MEITPAQDLIDSRDVLARIAELEADEATLDDDEAAELASLRDLADQGETATEDWTYGATLVRDSYFVEYAEEFAEDIGAIDRDAQWPFYCIDWDRAAADLKVDFTPVTFGGVTYWVR